MIKWSDNFSCGSIAIDEQHKKLIDLIDTLVSIVKSNRFELSNLLEVVTEMDDYIKEHFAYEEYLMDKYQYPERDNHVSQHNRFREKIQGLNIFNVDNSADFYNDFLVFTVDWLSLHIMKTDKKLGAYLSDKV